MKRRPFRNFASNLVSRALVNRSGDDGATAQVGWIDDRVTPDVEHLQTQGVHFRAPVDAEGVLVSPAGVADSAVLLCASDRTSLPVDVIGEGEGGLHYLGAWRVYINGAGEVHVGAKVAADAAALASVVDAELTAIKADLSALTALLVGHTHAGVLAGAAVSGTSPAFAAYTPHTPSPVGSNVLKLES